MARKMTKFENTRCELLDEILTLMATAAVMCSQNLQCVALRLQDTVATSQLLSCTSSRCSCSA